jgi:hypothetical protein
MTPSIHQELLLSRADGPGTAEHWLMLENMPQSGASARPELALRCPEPRVTGQSCAPSGSYRLTTRVFREVPGGPDQTQNA